MMTVHVQYYCAANEQSNVYLYSGLLAMKSRIIEMKIWPQFTVSKFREDCFNNHHNIQRVFILITV